MMPYCYEIGLAHATYHERARREEKASSGLVALHHDDGMIVLYLQAHHLSSLGNSALKLPSLDFLAHCRAT